MSYLLALSLTTGILCGLWIELSAVLGLIAWAGFAGCTAFFAAGGKKKGLYKAFFSCLSGVFWAVVTMQVTDSLPIPFAAAISTGVVTFIMCYQSRISIFEFIPGTFIGSIATFASGGDWKGVAMSLVVGMCLGFICEFSGVKLHTNSHKIFIKGPLKVSEGEQIL